MLLTEVPPTTTTHETVQGAHFNSQTKDVRSKLSAGDYLARGDKLTSPNGLYTAELQHDSNFVIKNDAKVLWDTLTCCSHPLDLWMVLQSDGNLVLYQTECEGKP